MPQLLGSWHCQSVSFALAQAVAWQVEGIPASAACSQQFSPKAHVLLPASPTALKGQYGPVPASTGWSVGAARPQSGVPLPASPVVPGPVSGWPTCASVLGVLLSLFAVASGPPVAGVPEPLSLLQATALTPPSATKNAPPIPKAIVRIFICNAFQ